MEKLKRKFRLIGPAIELGVGGLVNQANTAAANRGKVPVDGPNTLATFRNALAGGLFKTGGVAGGNIPPANAHTLIYNTGHGGLTESNAVFPVPNLPQPLEVPPLVAGHTLEWHIGIGSALDVAPPPPSKQEYLTDADGTDLLQISTTVQFAPSVMLFVNGTTMIGWQLGSLLVSDPTQVLDLGGLVSPSTSTYQVHVPHSLLGKNRNTTTIDLASVPSEQMVPSAIVAVLFKRGIQDYIALP